MFKRKEYVVRDVEESVRIFTDEMKGLGDKDIHNLELIMYSIRPGSFWFRRGCISSLRKAIKLLEANQTTKEAESYVSGK